MHFDRPGFQVGFARVDTVISVAIENTGKTSINEPLLEVLCKATQVGEVNLNSVTGQWEYSFFKGSIGLSRVLHPQRAAKLKFTFALPDQADQRLTFILYARDSLPLSAEVNYNEIAQLPWTKKIIPLLAPE